MMILGAISVYAPPGYGPFEKALYLSGWMLVAGAPPTQIWAAFGVAIRRLLQSGAPCASSTSRWRRCSC